MNMDDEALQNRKKDLDDNFARIVEYASKNKPDVFLISGDIFDLPTPSKQSLLFFTKQIRALDKGGIKVFMVWGDHDIPKVVSNSGSAIDIFKNAAVGTIFGSTRTLQKKRIEVDGKSICISGKSAFQMSTVSSYGPSGFNVPLDGDYNILMLHGHISTKTNPLPNDAKLSDNHEVFSAADLPSGLNYLALGQNHGHFEHDHDTFRVCNAGSTERLTWSELDEPKGFVWAELDGSATKTEFIKLPMRKMERKAFDLSALNDNNEVEDRIGTVLTENRDKQIILRLDIGGKISLERHSSLRLGRIYAKYRNRFFHLQLDSEELGSSLTKSSGNNLTQTDPIGAFVHRIDTMASMPELTEDQRIFLRDLKKRGVGYLKGLHQQ